MRTLRMLVALATTVVLTVGAGASALAQEEAEAPSPYFFGTAEGFLHHDLDNPLGCDVGFTSDSTLTGESTLLGATTVKQLNCYVPTDTFDNTSDGTVTFTGENGDSITGTMTANCLPDWTAEEGGVFTCIGEVPVTGGTGAFEGATGTIYAVGVITNVHSKDPDVPPEDAPSELIFEGLIDY